MTKLRRQFERLLSVSREDYHNSADIGRRQLSSFTFILRNCDIWTLFRLPDLILVGMCLTHFNRFVQGMWGNYLDLSNLPNTPSDCSNTYVGACRRLFIRISIEAHIILYRLQQYLGRPGCLLESIPKKFLKVSISFQNLL